LLKIALLAHLYRAAKVEPESSKKPTITPDGRYLVVKGKLWRCSNPALEPEERSRLVKELMTARRAVKAALQSQDPIALKLARQSVDQAKVALGERGPVWWTDSAPDYGRKKIEHTPYADWYASL
jgi:hypothetical protein